MPCHDGWSYRAGLLIDPVTGISIHLHDLYSEPTMESTAPHRVSCGAFRLDVVDADRTAFDLFCDRNPVRQGWRLVVSRMSQRELEDLGHLCANVGASTNRGECPGLDTARPFWLVWRMPAEGMPFRTDHLPTRMHRSELEARVEAKRLAALHSGARFVVMRATAAEETRTTTTAESTEYAR